MLVEIDIETLDNIFKQTLIKDLQTVKEEIKRLKDIQPPASHHIEDLKYQKKLKKAYKCLIRYTHSYDEAQEILGKGK